MPAPQERYKRNYKTISLEEQQILAESVITVIGCGGLGGFIIEGLARSGVGTLRLVDFDTFDERIPDAYKFAEQAGMEVQFLVEEAVVDHPNTVRINLFDEGDKRLELVGISIGGGTIEITEINSFKLRLSGGQPAILVIHRDQFGMISSVTSILAKHEINISHMEMSRKERGDIAIMVIEMDQKLDEEVMGELNALPDINHVIRMDN